jgi:YVTN family beta-propeller protein
MTSTKRRLNATVLGAVSALIGIVLPVAAGAQEGVMASSSIKGNPTAVCGNLAYVTNSYSNTLSVIDINQSRLLANLPAGAPHPSGLRFLPDGRHLVISFIGEKVTDAGELGIMDLQTGKLVKTIAVEAQSERFDITPDGKRAYVANLVGQSVSVVDLEKGEVTVTIPSPEKLPFNVLVSPKGLRVFVAAAAIPNNAWLWHQGAPYLAANSSSSGSRSTPVERMTPATVT